MASVYSTNESFACPFDPYCLDMCSQIGCPGNANMATPASWPHAQLKHLPSCGNKPHPSTATTSRFAFASMEELTKFADLVDEGFTPANAARQNHSLGTKRLPTVDGNYYSYFAACCSCISILCSCHDNYYQLCCI